MNEIIQRINLKSLDSTNLTIFIGIIPPILLLLGFLTSWAWNYYQFPLILNFPPTYLIFNLLIFLGTIYILKKSGLIVSSYSWIVFSIYGIASMSEIYILRILTLNNALISERNSVSIITELNSLLWILIAIGIATYIVKRNFYHLLFFMGLFSSASVPGFPMIVGENLPNKAVLATSFCAIMATLGTVILSFLILQFSRSVTEKAINRRTYLAFLLILILANPIAKLMPILILTTDIPILTLDIWLQIVDEQLHSIWPIGAAVISGGVYLATRPQSA